MNEAMMVPLVLILMVAIYALIVKRRPKDKREVLFHKIIDKGCEDCGGDFDVVHNEITPKSEMFVECKFCSKPYKIDYSLQWAWRL